MGVGEQDIEVRVAARDAALLPSLPDAGARIDDDHIVVLAPDLDAGRIAAVLWRTPAPETGMEPRAPQQVIFIRRPPAIFVVRSGYRASGRQLSWRMQRLYGYAIFCQGIDALFSVSPSWYWHLPSCSKQDRSVGSKRWATTYPTAGRFRARWISNDKAKGKGNKKSGNKYLAWAFSEAAEFARRIHPEARSYFNRKMQQTNFMIASQCPCP